MVRTIIERIWQFLDWYDRIMRLSTPLVILCDDVILTYLKLCFSLCYSFEISRISHHSMDFAAFKGTASLHRNPSYLSLKSTFHRSDLVYFFVYLHLKRLSIRIQSAVPIWYTTPSHVKSYRKEPKVGRILGFFCGETEPNHVLSIVL